MKNISFTINLSKVKDDFYKFRYREAISNFLGRNLVKAWLICCGVFLVIFNIVHIQKIIQLIQLDIFEALGVFLMEITSTGLALGGTFIFIAIFGTILIVFLVWKGLKINKNLFEERTYIFNDDGFRMKTNSTDIKLGFDSVLLIKESTKFLAIYTQGIMFVLSKDQIKKELIDIKKLLQKHIAIKKLKLLKK